MGTKNQSPKVCITKRIASTNYCVAPPKYQTILDIHYGKGYDVFLEALARLRGKNNTIFYKLKIILVGVGSKEDEVSTIIKKNRLANISKRYSLVEQKN